MTTTTSKDVRRACFACLVLATGALASSAALSAEPQSEAQVTVHAERPTTKVIGYTSKGIPIKVYQLTYHVSYADLDLASSAGADTFKKRVHDAAGSLCKDLDKLYPPAEPDASCARKAEDGAMSQVNTAITVAQTQEKTKAK